MGEGMIDQAKIEEMKAAIAQEWPEWRNQDHPAAGMEALGFAGMSIADVRALLAEREEMLAVLREVEYADNSDGEYAERCPLCGESLESYRPTPDSLVQYHVRHAPDCRLAALIGGTP